MLRERTNTPLQALVTMNDPQFVEAARHLPSGRCRQQADADQRINFIARAAAGPHADGGGADMVRTTAQKFGEHYAAHVDEATKLIDVGDSEPEKSIPPADLAAWTMVANQLMNLDEVLNK